VYIKDDGDFYNLDSFRKYASTMYWALQTLTTVGYGDFSPTNSADMIIACVWMFVGAAANSITLGQFTSMIIDNFSKEDSLKSKLSALD